MQSQEGQLRKALIAIRELKRQLQEARTPEPIAIIGIGCRFPGGVSNTDGYWELLKSGQDAIQEVPADRWKWEEWYDETPNTPGKMYTRWGGFLENSDRFDPAFFGISPREAQSIDPQQRLLLEVSWELFENAGLTKSDLLNSETGVYVGICNTDYQREVIKQVEDMNPYSVLGTLHSAIAGRLSYWLGLKGPNIAIDTACSSSLVAIHMAVQALRNQECKMAIAGGANMILSPEGNVYFSQLQGLSPTGRCHAFSADGDGFVRSEGCGMVLLKRLSDAQKDGDQILALIRGSAINQDGQSQGFTAPNGPSQQEVIRKALQQAQIEPSQIDYIEAHGTGTPLGDPIEVNAIADVLGEKRSKDHPILLGSVKSNIGHTEAAAGVAGLIKVVLCLQQQQLPKSIHFNQPNPHIQWQDIPVKVVSEMSDWKKQEGRSRMAGVSGFGLSGTNAHLILEEAPPQAPSPISSSSRTTQLFLLSANDSEALKAQAQQLIELIQQSSELSAETLAYNLAIHRTHFSVRLAIPAQNLQQLQAALVAFVQQQEHPLLVQAQLQLFKKNNAFLFTGGGAQYAGMGKALYQQEPSFAKAIDQCAAIALHYLPVDLRDILFAEPDSEQEQLLHRIDYMQPALFAFEYAACQLWMEWGVSPQLLIGHSLGEIVAACIGGLFALEDGIRLICSRGKLMQSLPPGGAMMSIQMDAEELQPLIKSYQGKLAIGVINGPQQTVLSGKEEAILDIQEQLEQKEIKTKRLQVSHASHSPLMQPILEEYRKVVESINFKALHIPLVSNLSGQIAQEEITTPDYWLRHLRQTVRFAQGVQQLEQSEMENYIELGPHPVLLGIAGQCIEESSNINWLASARREEGFPTIYHSLAKYFVEGGSINWKAFFKHQQSRITLPNYPFQRKRFWLDSTPTHSQTGSFTGHPLLGSALSVAGGLHIFETTLSIQQLPFLGHHQVYGQTIIAGAIYCEIIQVAISQLEQDYHLAEILTHAPVLINEEQEQRIQLILDPPQQETIAFTFYQLNPAKEWVSCASGNLQLSSASNASESISLPQLQAQYPQAIDTEAFYENFASLGIHYGPLFRGVKRLWKADGKVLAQLQLPEEIESNDHDRLHPVLLDSAFQLAGQLIDQQKEGLVQLLYSVEGYQLYRAAGRELWVELESIAQSPLNSSKIRCWDTQGQLIAQIEGLHVKGAHPEQIGGGIRKDWLYQLQWTPISLPPKGQSLSSIITGDQASGIPLLELLANEGQYIPQWQEAILALVASQAQQLIVLWASSEKDPAQAAQQLAIQGLQQLQQLVQFQQAGRLEGLQTIWWITSGVHSQTNEAGLTQSTLWGLARSFQQEHPEIPLKLLDREEDLSPLATLLNSHCDEQQFAMIEGQSCGLRLRKWAAQEEEHREMIFQSSDCSVLITGGLGELGLLAAQWLVEEHSIKYLVLLGRSQASEEALAVISKLEERGTIVDVQQVDVSQYEAVKHIVDTIPKAYPLKGILHCAGVFDPAVLSEQNANRFEKVFRPKVIGAWNLHRLSQGMDLDVFVLYSSAAAIMGTIARGQSNYAAANSFLDHLAQFRAAQQMVGHAINWGPWATQNLLEQLSEAERQRLYRQGFEQIDPKNGMSLLLQILSASNGSHAVLPLNLDRLKNLYQDQQQTIPNLLKDLIQIKVTKNEDSIAFPDIITQLPTNQRLEKVCDLIREQAAKILSLNDYQQVLLNKSLLEQGMDSLMAVELKNRLSKVMGCSIPVVLLLKKPHILELAQELLQHYMHFPDAVVQQALETPMNGKSEHQAWPLSSMQSRLWFVDRLASRKDIHNLFVEIDYQEEFVLAALQTALAQLIERHEMLRACIVEDEEGAPHMQIQDAYMPKLKTFDLRKEQQKEESLNEIRQSWRNELFDFSKPAIRFAIVKLHSKQSKLLITNHHLFFDGLSMIVMVKEIIALYTAAVAKENASLAEMTYRYTDFILLEQQKNQQGHFKAALNYWETQLKALPYLNLPIDRPYPISKSYQMKAIDFEFAPDQTEAILAFIKAKGTTLYTLLLSAYAILLYRYTQQEDFSIGTVMANREDDRLNNLIGFFANTLPIRCDLSGQPSALEFVRRMQQTVLEGIEYQEAPLNEVANLTLKDRSLNVNPLYNVSFVLDNFNLSELPGSDSNWQVFDQNLSAAGNSTDDISIIMMQHKEVLRGVMNYNIDIFDHQTIQRMVRHYQNVLMGIVNQAEEKVSRLRYMTEEEYDQLVLGFNQTQVDFPQDQSLVQLFRAVVDAQPNAIALQFCGQTLSYLELDQRSDQLAIHLLERGVQPGDRMGILCRRGFEMIIAVLGILKVRGVYIPLNADDPKDRLQYVLKDAAVKLILSQDTALLEQAALTEFDHLLLDQPSSVLPEQRQWSSDARESAYIMYTSGTTGQPKGILVNQQNVLKLVHEKGAIAIHADDRVLQWSKFSFDGSVYEIFNTLLKGATLCLIKKEVSTNPELLAVEIKESQLSVVFITTALFNSFVDYDPTALASLRLLLFGGEMVSPQHVKKALEVMGSERIIHMYGPTETVVYATYYPIASCGEFNVPIGRPLSNTTAYIVDPYGELCALGITGELWLGGAGVAEGYINKAALSAEKFISHPFDPNASSKLYKSGDLVRQLPDGNIEFKGRKDGQVKIRGYRIELGEIESILSQHSLVKQCMVMAQADTSGTKRLIAYIVSKAGFNKKELIRYLKEKLPDYMIPTALIELDAFPLNANGKIDRERLPRPVSEQLSSSTYVAPQSELEKGIAKIWKELLQLEKIGIYDNFFELGGHSLLATRVITAIRKEFDVNLPVKAIFQYTCINDLVEYIQMIKAATLEKDNTETQVIEL